MDATNQAEQPLRSVRRGRPAKSAVKADDLKGVDPVAAEYAVRVWNGQSPDLPVSERIDRVLNALRAQKLLIDGLSFPPAELPPIEYAP